MAVAVACCLFAPPSPGQEGPLSGLFYQPWQEDLAFSASEWQHRMDRLREEGLNALYIQWIRYGETDFLNACTATGEPLLQVILNEAAVRKIRIYMGLFCDPDFFRSLALPAPELQRYLTGLRKKALAAAREFQARYGSHPAFHGWYMPEEIDDLHWRTRPRQEILSAHIRCLEARLRRLAPRKPVAVSSFFSGASSPEAYAAFCRKLLDGFDHLLLVQDGLGTGRMDIAGTRVYHSALNRAGGDHPRLFWVVELFNDAQPGPGFIGQPASPRQVRERLGILHENFTENRLVGFSLRYWLQKKFGSTICRSSPQNTGNFVRKSPNCRGDMRAE